MPKLLVFKINGDKMVTLQMVPYKQVRQIKIHQISVKSEERLCSRLLFMARANPTIEDIQERTPIYLAAERGHTHVVDFLADKFKVIEIPFY